MKTFDVWIIGRMLETKTRIEAPLKADAMLTLALRYGVKSFQCDAALVRPGSLDKYDTYKPCRLSNESTFSDD